jgi:hypothetical protein
MPSAWGGIRGPHHALPFVSNTSHYVDKYVTIRYQAHVVLIADPNYTAPGPIRVELGLYQGATLGGIACD